MRRQVAGQPGLPARPAGMTIQIPGGLRRDAQAGAGFVPGKKLPVGAVWGLLPG